MIKEDKFYNCEYGWVDEEYFKDFNGYDDYEILRYCDNFKDPYDCENCPYFTARELVD